VTTPRKAGTVAAIIHLVFVVGLACAIFARHLEGAAWLYVALPDLPVHFLLGFLSFIMPWPSSPLSESIFLLIWFGVLGTAQWFVIGWAAARYTSK
jgi:hypothetical protein